MKKTTLIASVAISAVLVNLSGSAFAQSAPDVLNSQIQLGDVFANMDVIVVDDHSGDVSSVSLSTGNAASGFGVMTEDRHVESEQTMIGNSTSIATLEGGRVFGTASVDATAYGNSTTGSQYQGDRLDQAVGTSQISSTATVNHISATNLNASATSAANIHDLTYSHGTLNANANQTTQANVDATVDAIVCCSVDDTNANSLAVGNSYQSSSTYSNAYANVQQNSSGATITADTLLTQPQAHNVTANSQAMANNIVMDNSWGYSQLDGSQTNSTAIATRTEIVLNDWDGNAAISAYGIGNSALQTNIGSDQNAYFTQTNSGSVDSLTNFEGGNGGAGGLTSSSTSIGNSYTGYVCATCQSASPGGHVTQTNSGNISANGQTWARSGGNVYGSAAAIGNSSNYSTNNSGGD